LTLSTMSEADADAAEAGAKELMVESSLTIDKVSD
jgi:hypothetical protein